MPTGVIIGYILSGIVYTVQGIPSNSLLNNRLGIRSLIQCSEWRRIVYTVYLQTHLVINCSSSLYQYCAVYTLKKSKSKSALIAFQRGT